ncbi:treslin [Melanotaenia boesemani]|uniref:treslin n=1 Tax=Melanotaenia boesemani TaxID=1250792 RepID=UPI001C05671E|nr:treslin [Melanotaenia boesemani]
MALHNLVFVIDIDNENYESGDRLDVRNQCIKRGILQILLYFGYKYGFEKVRWGYKFFQSKTGRNASFISRVSDFKELRHKTFEDFEQEFEAKDTMCPSHQKQQYNRSVSVQNALKEALLDFQWDRPDITSPTKVSLRPRKLSRGGKASLSQEDYISTNGRNFVFIVSQCPLSRTQLVDYLSLKDDGLPTDVTEYIISKSLKDMLFQRQVVLHWIDSSSHIQVARCKDYLGSDKLSEVLTQVGGRVFPVVALLNLCWDHKSDLGFTRKAFAFKSSIGFILSSQRLYRLVFPAFGAVLKWEQGNVTQSCGVTMEPVSRRQRLVLESVEVCLKGVLRGWDDSSLTQTSTESWLLQGSSSSDQGTTAFQHLLMELSARGLHMFAEVYDNGLVYSAVFSPQSQSTALLTILQPVLTQHEQLLRKDNIVPVMAETSADLPDVVNSVLGVVYDIMNEDGDDDNDKFKDHPVPEWAQQEFSRNPVTTSMLETWFPQSDYSGVSSHLMESLRLLHAVPEQREEESSVPQQELIGGLSELYKTSQDSVNKKGKKRGANCTPVKQKMKTMSRSLQMLNVARLNVKAQKNQTEAEPLVTESRVGGRPGKRTLSDRSKPLGANTMNFPTEAELLAYLKTCYNQTLTERDSSLITGVQQLLTAVKTFLVAESDLEVKASLFVQQHLFKTSKSIRQHYGVAGDVDNKVRECQLQVVLRLELCKPFTLKPPDSLDVDQMAEEAAEMLRIISLTKDPVCLARFLQDEVLPGFLTAVPRVLADIYHSLGTQLPEALLAALPADFFSDESVAKDSISPSASSPPVSTHGLLSDGKDGLQDLRNRSTNKRRSGMLTRHRSMTESSQSLRQIEMPKKTTKAPKSSACAALEKPAAKLQPQKQETQEVTKVRRNLFNQGIVSPSKTAKLPRSQSVSTVEGLKRKRSHESEERHKLLTKKVCETPLHKQVSSRFLHLQKMRRRSDITEECVVEESPVKPAEDLRRSPRIKKLARRHSSTFYLGSQPRSRNLDKALSSSQLALSDGKVCEVNLKTVQSPMRLLFGAAKSPIRPPNLPDGVRITRSRLSTDSSVFESPNKTPTKSPRKHGSPILGNLSPRTSRTSGTPRTPKTPPSTKMCIASVAESPVAGGMSLRGSPFRSPAKEPLVVETPTKKSPVRSPLKGILRTPVKALGQHSSFSGSCLNSPVSRTPKKSVTWSPSPQKCRVVKNSATFKVPESPNNASCTSLRLLKTPNKSSSPVQSTNTKKDIFRTPDKICQVNLVKISEQAFQTSGKNLHSSENPNRFINPGQSDAFNVMETLSQLSTPPSDQHILPQPNTSIRAKTLSPTHQMITRSGRTPGKSFNATPPCDPTLPPSEGANFLVESGSLLKSAEYLTRTKSGQEDQITRHNLRSRSSQSLASELRNATESAENLLEKNLQSHTKGEVQTESFQSSDADSSLHTESQEFDSSQGNSATTDSDSLDIVDAAVVKTQYSGGLKMNISFTRKPSLSNEDCQSNTVSPKLVPSQSTPTRSYGFRQTPDRQQREAAARLGYENYSPRFSTPRGAAKPHRRKGAATPNVLTYQVELEMQTSGIPKLKIKRTDSTSADIASDGGPSVGVKPHLESPLSLFSKHKDPGCVSPSVCAHVTPAKSTPGKGSIQTYICQSYTPTRHPAATMSPRAIAAEVIPLTPSPQSVGKVTPDNLNSWPRRKKAQIGVLGPKDCGLKGELQLEELLEEAELGVCRLQDFEESDDPSSNKAEKITETSKQSPSAGADVFPLSPLEDLYWVEKLAEQSDSSELQKAQEEIIWTSENGDVKSTVTSPSSKMRKPVTPSGILALTKSPLLFRDKTGSARRRTPNFKDEAASGRTEVDGLDLAPFSQPVRRSNTGKTYSRKRLIH